ncbi:MAG: hypothetical protein DRP71_10945, partial [Verrucomicrobia bacterium]
PVAGSEESGLQVTDATVADGMTLGVGQSLTFSKTIQVPAGVEGRYAWGVTANARGDIFEGQNRDNNHRRAATTTYLSVPELEIGVLETGAFLSVGQTVIYKIQPPAGADIAISLDRAGNGGWTRLVASEEIMPSLAEAELLSPQWNAADASLAIFNASGGTWYILAIPVHLPSSPLGFSLSASSMVFGIDSIGFESGSNRGQVTLPIFGTGLNAGVTASLIQGGTTITADEVHLVDAMHLYATFNLVGAVTGTYDILLRQDGFTRELEDAFAVTSAEPGALRTAILMPEFVRTGREFTAWVEYENTGGTDLIMPMIGLSGSRNQEMRLEGQNNPVTKMIFLGLAPEGVPWILGPGQSGRVPVTITALSGRNHIITHPLTAASTDSVDWDRIRDTVRPGNPVADWDAAWEMMVVDYGNTAGGFVRWARDAIELWQLRTGRLSPNPTAALRHYITDKALGLRARLEGQVQLAGTGQPLGGVNVALYDEEGGLADITVSTRDGFVRFMEAGAGTFDVVFDGYLPPEDLEPVVLVADVKAGPVTWALGGGAKLQGSVLLPATVDPGELLVSVIGADGTLDVSGLDDLGRYWFSGLPEGNYAVTFSGTGVVSESVDGVVLEEGLITEGPIFSARAGGVVSGMVVRASDDEPIEGARVVANDGNGNGGATESAADGTFTIEGLASGTYRVAAFADTYASSAISDATVVSGSTLIDVDLSLEAGASVSGTVTAVAIPVTDIFVALTNSDGVTREVRTDESGNYAIGELPAGDWNLTVATDLFADHSEVMTLATGEQKTLNVALVKLAHLSGTVTDGTSLVSGVQAKLTDPDGNEGLVFFDPDGRLNLGLEDPGEYVISLLDGSQRQVFTVTDSSSEPEISFELEAGRLEGTVVTSDGETPLAWVEVVLIHTGQPILVARTNGDGEYRFPNVAAGTYSIEFADQDSFFSGIESVVVEKGETTILPTAIAGSSSLTVEVLSDGQPVGSGGLVALEKVGLDLGPATSRLDIFNVGESVGFTGLSLGEYRLHAITAGANSGYVTVTVEAGENSLQLPVYPSAELSGTVRDEEGDGMAGVQISAYSPAKPDDLCQAYTEEDGHFQISTLLPGSYVVVIAPSVYSPGDDLLKPVVRSGVVLTEGETTRIHAVMSQGGAGVGGTVSSDDGSIPLYGWVVLRNSDGVVFSRAEMAPGGQYTLPEVPAGDYTLSATTSGFTVEERDLAFSGTAISDYVLEATWTAGFLRSDSGDESQVSYSILWGEGLFNIGWLNRIKSALWEGLRTLLDAPPKKARNLPHVEWRDECDCADAKAKLQEAYQWQKRAFDQWDNWNKQWEANQDILWSRIGELGVNLLQFAVNGIDVAKDAPAIVDGLKESREALWHSVDDTLSKGNYDSDFFNESMEQIKQLDSLIHEFSNMFTASIAKTAAGSYGSILDPNSGLRGTIGSISKYINEPGSLLSTKGGIWNMLNDINSFVGNLNTVAGLINDLGKIGGKFGKATGALSKATAIIDMVTKSLETIRSSMMAMEAEATSSDLYDQLLEKRDEAFDEAMRLRDECFEDCCDPLLKDCCDPEVEECCDPSKEDCDPPPDEPEPPNGPSGTTNGIGSFDPNEKLTTGAGIGGFITPESAIIYTINFENVSSATAAAQVVTVTDPLPDNLDWSTVELLTVGFNGETLVAPMSGLQTWSTRATVESDPYPVEVLFAFDPDTGLVELVIRSVDAITGELPDDPFAGFLPPNDDTGRGEGFVSFVVKPVSGLIDGTEILNTAEIVFDVNEPIVTNESVNTIDSKAPTALIVPLSERSGETFTVTWAGDDSGGAGVSFYDVYVSIDGGAWSPWLMGTEEISGRFEGERGSTYAFYVHATDSLGYANPVAPTAQAQTIAGVSFLINISNRGGVGTGPNIMIPGFVLNGTGTKRVLVRAVGPTLGGFGVQDVLEDPQLKVFSGQDEIESNDNWGDSSNATVLAAAAARVGAFPMDSTSGDAATLLDLVPGPYTVKVSGVADGTGVALVEVYDADETDNPTVKIVNISNRGEVGVGAAIMIPGFVVGGENPKTVLIRGVGPKLAGFGVQGVLENPILTVFSVSDPVVTNDDWGDATNATELAAAAAAVGAFPLDIGSQDAAVLITLDPGAYTVKVSGVDNTTGVALVEIYEVD